MPEQNGNEEDFKVQAGGKLKELASKLAPKGSFSYQDESDIYDFLAGSTTGGIPASDGFIVGWYTNRQYEHQDTVSLMQRYFAWSIYALIVLWLALTLSCVFIASIKPIPQCLLWTFILGAMGAFLGLGLGILYSLLTSKEVSTRNEKLKTEHREKFFKRLLTNLVFCSFLLGLLGMIIGGCLHTHSSLREITYCFDIKEPVLITLISTTTISILGIFACVMKWLFPHISGEKNKS